MMRFIPALLLSLCVVVPLSYAGAAETNLPVSLNDLKLDSLSWTFPLDEYAEKASVEGVKINGEDLFLMDSNNTLHSLELSRGVHKWILELSGKPTHCLGLSPDVVGIVIIDRMVLVKRATGARFLDKALRILPATSPAVSLESAYTGVFIKNKLVSVDARTGLEGWSYRFRDMMMAAPQISTLGSTERLYAVSLDGTVICLPTRPAMSAAPGKPVWSFKTNGRNSAEIVFAGDNMLVASEDCSLYAFDKSTGFVNWKYLAGVPLKNAPQAVGKNVYQKCTRTFTCLAQDTGEVKWTFDRGEFLGAVVGEIAYVWTLDKTLALLNTESGEVKVIPNVYSELLVIQKGTDLFGLK